MSVWDARAEAYRESATHREGVDLDRLVAGCEPCPGLNVLDVGSGGGHVARRLREAGCDVVTVDPSPAMQADVRCRAEELPFADASFDVVTSRIAAHHFEDTRRAVAEMARVSRKLVVIEDTLFTSDAVEEAERVRDPSHVRSYSEEEWCELLDAAGLELEGVDYVEKTHRFDDWLSRTGCEGEEAERVRTLLAGRACDGGQAWTDTKILLKTRKRVG